MFNLNEKYFPISERCGRNHQNKFLFTSPKETFSPWELKLSNFSLFQTAISNYTYALLTCVKLSNFSIFPNTLSNFAYIFFYRGLVDKCVQTDSIIFLCLVVLESVISDLKKMGPFRQYVIPAETPSMDP